MISQHGGARANQGYKRTPAQLENIAKRKVWGTGGRFIPLPAAPIPSTSWWADAKTDDEFTAAHVVQLPRIQNIQARLSYKLSCDEF